jgi:hypothetical protein
MNFSELKITDSDEYSEK